MNNALQVVNIVLPVLLALGLGVLARAKKLVSAQGVGGIKALVTGFTLPAVLFNALYKAKYDATIAACAAVMFSCCLLGLLLGKLAVRAFRLKRELLPFLTTGFEAGMMGYALYMMLFGADSISTMAVADLGQVTFVFSVYMSLLNARNGMGRKQTLRAMFTSPIFLSMLAGIAVGATGLGKLLSASPAGETLGAVLSFVSAPTGFAILFAVGYEIHLSRTGLKDAAIAAAIRLVIMAALCALAITVIGLFVPVDKYLRFALLLMFLLPGPYVLPVFAKDPADIAYASTCLSLYTLLSVALFAVLAAFAVG